MNETAYSELYLSGVDLFNRQQFFECHEVWEDLWRETDGAAKQFFKGLIQGAVSLMHLREGNLVGARKLLIGAHHYLEPYAPQYLGLDVSFFLRELSRCFQGVPPQEKRIAKSRLGTIPFPEIHLYPPGV